MAFKMTMGSLRYGLAALLRRFGPVYRLYIAGRQFLADCVLDLARVIFRKSVTWGPPAGTFSALDQVRSKTIEGEIVLEGQQLIPAARTSVREWRGLGQNGRQPWPIFWSRHRNARLVGPSLAVVNEQKRVLVESVFGAEFFIQDPSYRYMRIGEGVHMPGVWTSVISRWSKNYYHWLIDCLPRLALLPLFPPETGILIPEGLPPYALETLDLLGLGTRCRPTPEDHLIVDDYYFSTLTSMSGCDNPYAVFYLRASFLDKGASDIPLPKRFYIRRSGKMRGVANEPDVIRFFEERGWGIVDTEKLTFRQQILLFSQAEAFCTVHGAAMTNLVWCSAGCCAIEMFASNFVNGCYEGIADYVETRYVPLIFEGDSQLRAIIDITALRKAVDSLTRPN